MDSPSARPIEIAQLPVEHLRVRPGHPRRMSESERGSLTRSIKTSGFTRPIVARADGEVIDGASCLDIAIALGYATVPVVLLDVSPEQGRLLGLQLNRIRGEFDDDLLARLLLELDALPEIDLTLAGFEDDELAALLHRFQREEQREQPEGDLDEVIEAARGIPRTQPGDVWQLGDHRLICGDSTDPHVVARLLADVRPRMAFTDPPYNVDYGGGASGRRRRIANDAMSPEAFAIFCAGWISNLLQHVDGAIYLCMSSSEWPRIDGWMREAGAHWSSTIIWMKDSFTLGRSDYQRQFEPIWYGWREGVKRCWDGARDESDVWQIPRPTDSPLHPTMKPIELVERAIEHSSQRADVVLDLFLGSGSTLIGAERTGRVCYGVELDPHYVDVIVARWEAFTGGVARRLDDE